MVKPIPIPETEHVDRDGEPFRIRETHEDDAADLRAMVLASLDERLPGLITQPDEFTFDDDDERAFIQRHRESPVDAAFLAVRPGDGSIVGFLNGAVTSRKLLSHTWRLGMTVSAAARNRGIGRALLRRAIDYVSSHPQLVKIALEVVADNEPALNLYRNLGFVEEGRRVGHVGRLQADGGRTYVDQILMYRWLESSSASLDAGA